MLVHLDGIAGSVGGGHLEFKALAEAKSLLQTAMAPQAELLDYRPRSQPRPMLRRKGYAALRAADARSTALAGGLAAAFGRTPR